MAGRIKIMIDTIIDKKTKGNLNLKRIMEAKLIIKGINPMNYNSSSPDDPVVITKLETLADDMGIQV